MFSSPSVINNFTTTTALYANTFTRHLFFSPPPPASKAESSETHRGRLSSSICILLEIISPIFQPRQYYFVAYSRRFKLQNCIPKKEGKLHREDSKRNAKEIGGERRRSNKRMQFTKREGVLALSIISYTAAGPASRVLIALQASHYTEFRRLISKSAFYRSKFASSRCLWTRCKQGSW